MALTDCERKFQGISSIMEGHLPLQQHALQAKGKSGLGFPSFFGLSVSVFVINALPKLAMLLPEGQGIVFLL
jgi:hypothetical protein